MRLFAILAAFAVAAVLTAGATAAKQSTPSCSYSDGVITVSDFPRQAILDIIDVNTNTVTDEFLVAFHGSTTVNVPVATSPTLYRFLKYTGQHDVIAECFSN